MSGISDRVVIVVDEVHPLIERIASRLTLAGARPELLPWHDLVFLPGADELTVSALADAAVVYLDRMGENERSYDIQLRLLALWDENRQRVVNPPSAYWHARDKAQSRSSRALRESVPRR